jgi:uncharacterized protein YcbK (DUF882 family)
VVGRTHWHLVFVSGAGQRTRELKLSKRLVLTLLWLVLGTPLIAGIALGARNAEAQRIVARLGCDEVSQERADRRRASYLVLARATQLAVKDEAPLSPPAPLPFELGEPKTPEHRRGHLRISSLRHGETIDVVPWDAQGARNDDAFAAISHLFRCRITGHEVPANERLIKLLIALNDLYDKPLQLISGHRVPGTIDTSPTSQHVYGTAADVRVPGVSIDELRAVALKLGARGVGLYTEKQFVHIDFRAQAKYQWTDLPETDESSAEAAGELASK